MKVLALTAAHRWSRLGEVPTFAEAGLAGFPGGPIFWGVVVPSGTPGPIVKRLHDELSGIVQSPKFAAFASENFLEPIGGPSEDFVAFLRKDRKGAEILVDRYMK